jgi:hypothetical protein
VLVRLGDTVGGVGGGAGLVVGNVVIDAPEVVDAAGRFPAASSAEAVPARSSNEIAAARRAERSTADHGSERS